MSQPSNAQPLQGTGNFSDYEAQMSYYVRSQILKLRTSLPVIVESVTTSGGLSPIGRVSIRPLIQQVDGDGNAVDHGIINNVPYLRIMGGANAVIIDPEVGDIGMALFADRDISAVKASGQQSPPGSRRKFDMADAVYMGCIIGAAPQQYIQFTGDGINLVSPTRVRIEAPDIEAQGNFSASGGTFTHNGVNVGSDHTHSDVQPGTGTSGPPVA